MTREGNRTSGLHAQHMDSICAVEEPAQGKKGNPGVKGAWWDGYLMLAAGIEGNGLRILDVRTFDLEVDLAGVVEELDAEGQRICIAVQEQRVVHCFVVARRCQVPTAHFILQQFATHVEDVQEDGCHGARGDPSKNHFHRLGGQPLPRLFTRKLGWAVRGRHGAETIIGEVLRSMDPWVSPARVAIDHIVQSLGVEPSGKSSHAQCR